MMVLMTNFTDCPVPEDYTPDLPLERNQLDQKNNLHGNLLVDICKSSQVRIVNGRFLGDSLGYFTFCNSNALNVINLCINTMRLSDIGEQSGGPHEILKAAFEVDKTLTSRENSWSNKLSELSKDIGISLNKHCNINFKQKLEDFYKNKIIFELSKIKDGN
ncbi:unnamed protein product [Mytilus coruscus]|uniref:DZIP3-like HEPN domain-containing protein n=1 Tax=Mytilus coruscus TaxID=42192 RepID=A0A6J8B1T4_MYTCO|nr:unnamed protein product [Mytilus coruscus]